MMSTVCNVDNVSMFVQLERVQEKEEVHNVIAALNDDSKHVVVQTAPAVRASLGEEFGMP